MSTVKNMKPFATIVKPFALAAVCGLCVTMSGCSRENEQRAAIRKASTDLSAVSSGAATASTNAHQQKLFDDAAKSAQAAAGDGLAGAAASILSATAAEGKAAVPDAAARTAAGGAEMGEDAGLWKVTEIGIFNRMSSLRSHLTHYMDHKQTAAAAKLFNPSEQMIGLDKAAGELDAAVAGRAKAKADLEQQIAALNAGIQTKNDEAKRLDEQVGNLRKGLAALSASDAATVVEQASAVRRQADKLRQEGQLIDADASQLRAQLPELQLAVAQIETQKKSIAQTKADLAEKLTFYAAQASSSDAEAAKIAAAIDAEVMELKKIREGAWTKSNDERLSLLRQALGTAQKAGQSAPLQSKLTVASLQQAIGDLHLTRSVEARAYGLMMGLLGTANPALPKADEYRTEVTNSDTARQEAATAAKEAYEAAKNAYATAPVRGSKDSADVKARLEALGASLDAVIQALESGSNQSLSGFGLADVVQPAAAPAAPAPAGEAAPAPTGEGAAASSTPPPELIAAVDALLAAGKAGDDAKMAELTKATSPLARQMMGLTAAVSNLDAACKEKFGSSFSDSMKGMPGMQMAMDFSALGSVTASSLKYEVKGDNPVTATTMLGAAPVAFVKDGAAWKLDMDAMAQQMGGNPAMAGMLGKIGPAMEAVAADVRSGKIATIGAVQAQIMAKVMGAGGPDK